LSEQNRKHKWKLKAMPLNHMEMVKEVDGCEDSSEVQQE
jgi:hypothetical protein